MPKSCLVYIIASLSVVSCVLPAAYAVGETSAAPRVSASVPAAAAPTGSTALTDAALNAVASAVLAARIAAIRTPKAPEMPRINGPRVYGACPGRPFSYKIPATGVKPLLFSAQGLPTGLKLDSATGIISGAVFKAGSYRLALSAANGQGKAAISFEIIIGDAISLTPPLGWNTYNAFRMRISDALIRAQADAMVSSGLADHGWSYLNIDDGWQSKRSAAGVIEGNAKFPDMKALAAYVHDKGLKFGVYSSPGPRTCARFEGTFGHEDLDAATYSEWGVDYLKYDYCFYESLAQGLFANEYAKLLPAFADRIHALTREKTPLTEIRPRAAASNERIKAINAELEEIERQVAPEKRRAIERAILMAPYAHFRSSLDKVNRDIIYSICQYGMGDVWEWGAQTGANGWRTTRDITPRYAAMRSIVVKQVGLEKWAGPGHWNDPDMLEIGNGELNPDEMYSQMTWWSLLAAPLLIGTDLTKMDELVVSILSNDEVIGVNQDALGKQGTRLRASETQEVWIKPLSDGTLAVGLFNLSEAPVEISVSLAELKRTGAQKVRDLWRGKELPSATANFSATVAPHGAEMFRLGTPRLP